jgi:hypothetical protein
VTDTPIKNKIEKDQMATTAKKNILSNVRRRLNQDPLPVNPVKTSVTKEKGKAVQNRPRRAKST